MSLLSSFAEWIDRLSWGSLLLVAIVLGLAPFSPEPHLWEKLKMLVAGRLSRPLDMFDLFLHSAPLLLVGIKLWRQMGKAVLP